MTDALIYGLASTRNGRIRYVGQTCKDIKTRFRSHRFSAEHGVKNHLYNWMRKESESGFQVFPFEIERGAEYNVAEVRWIAWYRRRDVILLNLTDGGRGNAGYAVSDLSKERMRLAALGKKKKLSEDEKKRRASQITEITSRPDVRRRISATQTGKKKSPEAIQKRTETRRLNDNYRWSPEMRARQALITEKSWEKRRAKHVVN